MRKILKSGSFKSNLLFLIFLFISNLMISQANAQDVILPDSVNSIAQEEQGKTQKTKKKKNSNFKAFGGLNFNLLSTDSELLKPTMAAGWLLGASYKKGNYFYWELGATLNNSIYNLVDTTQIQSTLIDGTFGVRNIDIPVTLGINLMSALDRVVGLRVYLSAIPSFAIRVGDNKLGITKDNINDFNVYGRAGVGVDVAFIFVEAGYSYGFMNLFKTDDSSSNPNQIFINLGFRF